MADRSEGQFLIETFWLGSEHFQRQEGNLGAYSALTPADVRPVLWVLLESLAKVFFMLLSPQAWPSVEISLG